MTINTTTNRVEFTGNGVTTVFSFPYYFLADADLVVLETVIATGVQSVKSLTTHYTVSGEGNPAGGSVTMLTAPASTVTLTIYRDPSAIQDVDLVEGDPLPVETAIEQPLDKLTMIVQRVLEVIGRSLRLPEGDTGFVAADMYMPAKVVRASKYSGWDADGKPIATAGTTDATPISSFMATVVDDTTARAARATLFAEPAINVKDYGATGDGATNDTAAIQAAIDDAPASGGTVFFPFGNYSIGKISIGVKSGVTLLGAGWSNTKLTLRNTTNDHMIVIGDGSTYTTGNAIRNMRLAGNSANQSAGALIRLHSAEDTHISGCYINDAKAQGILAEGTGTRNNAYVYVSDCYINTNLGDGIYALNQSYTVIVTGNVIAGNGKNPANGAGFHSNGNDTHTIVGNVFDENSSGIRLFNSSDCTVVGNTMENMDRNAITLDGSSTRNLISSNTIVSPSQETTNTYNGISLDVATSNVVTDNKISGTTITIATGIEEIGASNTNLIANNHISGTVTTGITKLGAATKVRGNIGYVTENEGVSNVADGATVSHGLATTPTGVLATTSVTQEEVQVTALAASNFTVSIKKRVDGSAGTTQDIYWRAFI
jgi:parallel beta-helix repeat protein